jgi:hypothetical protein
MSENYPCLCGCGASIEFVPYGKRRVWASEACRVRQYRRDNPDYVRRETKRSLERRAVPPHTECVCGCGGTPPPRAGTRGAQPKYASKACPRVSKAA